MMQELQTPRELAPDEQVKRLQFDFTGEWLPDLHPLKIGNGNYSDVQNIRYTKTGVIGCNGYTKINATTAIATYLCGRNGFQLRTPNTQKSYIFTQQWNATITASQLFTHKGVPPAVGDFEAITRADASGASIGFFTEAPNNDMVYCNTLETLIYGGEESAIGAFAVATSITGLTPVNPIIYTNELRNTATTAGNTVSITAATQIYLVGATRPLCGIKPYISTANASASSTTIAEWTGTAWSNCTITSDGTSDGTISHKTTGMILFNSTVSSSKPAFITDLLLYWYKVTLSAGSCTLYHLTVNAPMQNLVNLWDGVNRICIQCELNRAGIYEDYTGEVYAGSSVQSPITARFAGLSSSDHVILMFEDRLTAVKLAFLAGLVNTTASTVTIYYWNGSSFATVGTVYDGTLNSAGTVSMNQNGTVYWNPPAATSEHKVNLFSTYGYAYKFVWSSGLSTHTKRPIQGITRAAAGVITWLGHNLDTGDIIQCNDITQADWTALNGSSQTITVIDADTFSIAVNTSGYAADYAPATDAGTIAIVSANIVDGCQVDTIFGIPAVSSMGSYKFPFNYRNRLFLAGDILGKEGNALDYGVTNTSDSFNGEDSSDMGKRLYVGKNSSELVAAVNVFNRFGASLYNSELLLKTSEVFLLDGDAPDNFKISQISENLGIAAARTLCTAEVAFEVSKDAIRNIALWISSVGPVIFDAAVLVPLSGIGLYFDKTKTSTCVNFNALDKAHAWFDPNYYEWNVCLPSGVEQKTCNVWLAYDLINKKWTKRNTKSQPVPQATIRVVDDYGNIYFYGLIDTGYMVRLENGNLWNGIDSIEGYIITNNMVPTGSIFDSTSIRNIKLITEGTGVYDIIYTRSDIAIKGSGIDSGYLRVYGEVIEDSTCTAAYWSGEDFVCKKLLESQVLGGSVKWQDISGTVSIIGTIISDWEMEISTVAGNFLTAGFTPGVMIITSDPNNPGPFLCTSVTATKMVFASGHAIDFTAGTPITLSAMFAKVWYYPDGESTPVLVSFNKIQLTDSFTKFMSACPYDGLGHKFKFEFYSNALTNNIKPIAWGVQFMNERSEA
jgi:hypothetical protein